VIVFGRIRDVKVSLELPSLLGTIELGDGVGAEFECSVGG